MISLLSVYIAGLIFAACCKCESVFITPKLDSDSTYADNPVHSVNDIIKVQWETDYEGACNLFIWQAWPKLPWQNYLKILDGTTDTNYRYHLNSSTFITEPAIRDESELPVFYFALYTSDVNNSLASSGTFNVSGSVTVDETLSSATSVSIPSTTSVNDDPPTDSATNSHPTDSSRIAASESKESGLSTVALVGISVGVTVAGLLVSGVIGFCLWRRFRRGRGGSQTSESSSEAPEFSKAELGNTQILQIGRSELDSEREPQELWDTQKMAELGDENKVRVVVGLHEAP